MPEVTAQFKVAKYFGKASGHVQGLLPVAIGRGGSGAAGYSDAGCAVLMPLTLPFWLASGPAQFQQRVSEVLGDLEGHELRLAMRVVSQWQDSCSNLSVGSADQRELEQTVDHSTTIISSMFSVIYWALGFYRH